MLWIKLFLVLLINSLAHCLREFTHPAAAKSLQSCPTLCDPIDGSPPGSLCLGFSRQEHWSGLPFPSPMHESEKWNSLRDPMDCSLPGSSVHGIFQARVLEWGAIAFSTHGPQAYLAQWNYEPYPVGPQKTDGSWWRILTKCGPLEKIIANQFSILALRIVWKGKIRFCLLKALIVWYS